VKTCVSDVLVPKSVLPETKFTLLVMVTTCRLSTRIADAVIEVTSISIPLLMLFAL
jgi:hypothetical protein